MMAETHNRKIAYRGCAQALVCALVVINLLALIFSKTILDNILMLNSESVAWIDFATHATIVGFAFTLARKHQILGKFRFKTGAEVNADNILLAVMALFAIVVLAMVPHSISSGVEPVIPAIRHAFLVFLPIISFAYICPRVLDRRSYFVVFATLLFIFWGHSLLTVGFWLSNTKMLLYRDIARADGRAPMVLGSCGMFVTGMAWNPNTLAIALMLIPPMAAIAESMVVTARAKWFYRSTMVITAAHLLLTCSRAASFTLLASSILCIFLSKSGRLIKTICIPLISVLFVFLVFQTLQFGLDPSMHERIRIWSQEVSNIGHHPWGHGLPLPTTEHMPHSLVLGTIEYFGFAGLVFLTSIIGLLFLKAIENVKRRPADQFALITIGIIVVFHGLFEYYIGHPTLFANSLFWLVLGYLTTTPTDEKQPIES